jgi:hypothetical protein
MREKTLEDFARLTDPREVRRKVAMLTRPELLNLAVEGVTAAQKGKRRR